MTIILRQSTASQEVPLGHFLDSGDGDTAETALTIANTDIQVWKTGATSLANKNSGGGTHMAGGVYYATLDATDTNTIGPLVIFCHVSGALATKIECVVLDEAVYDVLFGTTAPSTYAGGDTSGVTTLLSRVVGTLASGTHNAQSGDAYARLGAPAGASVSADVAAVKAQTAAIETDTQDLQTQVGTDGAGLTAIGDTRLANLDATVSSRLATAGYTAPLDAAGTRTALGMASADLDTQLDAIVADTGELQTNQGDWATADVSALALEASLTDIKGATFSGATDSLEALRDRGDAAWVTATGFATPTNITAGTITTVTNLTNAPANGDLTATMKTSVTTAATAATPTAAAVTGAVGSVTGNVGGNVTGSVGSVVGDTKQTADVATLITTVGVAGAGLTALATQASVNTIDDFLDTEIAAILADTNELQTDWADGGRLDLLLDAAGGAGTPPTVEEIRAEMDSNSTQLAAIVADTNELQTNQGDWATATGFATPTNITAASGIALTGAYDAAKTAATQASVDAVPTTAEIIAAMDADPPGVNVIQQGGSAVVPTATPGVIYASAVEVLTPVSVSAPSLRSGLGMASANLDTQLAALPTDSDVQTAATAALNAYDPPTNAEMVARTLVAANYFDPATDTVAHVTLVDTTTTNTDMVAAAPAVTAIRTEIDNNSTQLAAIVADTNELQTDWADGGRLDLLLDNAGAAGVPPTVEEIRAEMDSNSTQLAAIVEDTGTTLPASLATIQADLDNPSQYKADVSTLALEATSQSILTDTGTEIPAAIAGIDVPTVGEIDTQLSSTHGSGVWGAGAGSGTGYYTDTVKEGVTPLDGVRVQLYTGSNRTGLAYEAYTNASGVFEMHPDPGTYYVYLDLAGYTFPQGTEVEVTEP